MNNLVIYRKRARMRQFDIARRLGVTEQLISKWECGRAEPHIEQAVDMARIIGVAPEKIFPEMFGGEL
jgi:transcriptional regulator with XRE-family HTH domain